MSDNRFDCVDDCKATHDVNNKCDGNCVGQVDNLQERMKRAQEHNE